MFICKELNKQFVISQVHSKHRNVPNTNRFCIQGERNQPGDEETRHGPQQRASRLAAWSQPSQDVGLGGGRQPATAGRACGRGPSVSNGRPRWARPRQLDLRAAHGSSNSTGRFFYFYIFYFHFLQKYIFNLEIYRNIPRPPGTWPPGSGAAGVYSCKFLN